MICYVWIDILSALMIDIPIFDTHEEQYQER